MAAKVAETVTAAKELGERLNGQTVKIEGKVGKDAGKLFGAITSQDVVDAMKAQLKVEVEKKNVALVQPIKRLGIHDVLIDLHPQVDVTIHVNVFDPNAPVEVVEAPVEEEAVEA
jgi:large subunit ribosomal protein L9